LDAGVSETEGLSVEEAIIGSLAFTEGFIVELDVWETRMTSSLGSQGIEAVVEVDGTVVVLVVVSSEACAFDSSDCSRRGAPKNDRSDGCWPFAAGFCTAILCDQ
jgi:hypothetical protein